MSEGQGPKPFSSDWYKDPPAPEPHSRRLPRRAARVLIEVGSKLPGERALSILVVLLLVVCSFWLVGPRGQAHVNDSAGREVQPLPMIDYGESVPTTEASISTENLAIGDPGDPKGPEKTAPKLNLQAPVQESTENGLLPKNRILTFYGFPGNTTMGILGEYDMDELLARLKEQAAAYEEADPSRPVLIAFEVIASVAQPDPQTDGSYLLDAPTELLDKYADFAEKNGILLFLDVQIGKRKVADEVKGLQPWLEKPFVHLAIDPEFAVRDGQIPSVDIGQVDASDITFAQNWLVDLAKTHDLPPKVLIVHQFHEGMIEHKDQLAPVSGVQLVIDADGWGPPDSKKSTYHFVNKLQEIEFNGIKLFYKQDDPIMTPEDILKLDPVPDLIIYQ
ncbi:MAG: hypothetical protein WBA63_13865 [Thermomicrobiales bacterium]